MIWAKNFKTHDGEDETDAEGSWAISYGDMVTLLLSFFILFFTTDPSAEKEKQLQSELLSRLSPQKKVQPQSLFTAFEDLKRSPAAISAFELENRTFSPKIKNALSQHGTKPLVTKDGSQLLVEFPGVSFFNSGQIELTAQGIQALRNFSKIYLPFAGKHQLLINSYTDSRKVRKLPGRRFKDNLELSALRSISAMRTLSSAGIPLSEMRLGGHGEFKATLRTLHASQDRLPSSKNPLLSPDLQGQRKLVLVIAPLSGPQGKENRRK